MHRFEVSKDNRKAMFNTVITDMINQNIIDPRTGVLQFNSPRWSLASLKVNRFLFDLGVGLYFQFVQD